MIDFDDGDQLLDLVGIAIVMLLAFGAVTLFLAATSGQQGASVPDTEWNLTRLNESHVRITHAGGEPIRTEKLSVTVDGTPRRPRWASSFLTADDSGVVRADAGSSVVLLWQRSEAERIVIERWRSASGAGNDGRAARAEPRPTTGAARDPPWRRHRPARPEGNGPTGPASPIPGPYARS